MYSKCVGTSIEWQWGVYEYINKLPILKSGKAKIALKQILTEVTLFLTVTLVDFLLLLL